MSLKHLEFARDALLTTGLLTGRESATEETGDLPSEILDNDETGDLPPKILDNEDYNKSTIGSPAIRAGYFKHLYFAPSRVTCPAHLSSSSDKASLGRSFAGLMF